MHRHPLTQSVSERLQRDRQHRPHAHAATLPNLDLSEVHTLAARTPEITASIFLPTHRSGRDMQQDHIRLKNQFNQARSMLVEANGEEIAAAILTPALKLAETPEFWAHPSDGLALFCRAADVRHLWLPTEMPELTVVSHHCHLKPLMPLLQGDGRFYLLELTQHGVDLHMGSHVGLQPIALPGAPTSIEEELGVGDTEHHTQVRTVHNGGQKIGQKSGQSSAVYFGTAGDENAKERIKQFFRKIDSCICALLHADRTPLVIAGVGYLLPLYWEVNRYPFLIQAGITGSPDQTALASLHDRAWEIVAPHFSKADDEARERYAQLHGSDRTSDDLETVLHAAFQGRIEDLFVASDSERWGTYDVLNGKVREHEPRRTNDDDLLNIALLQAIATRARTQVLPRTQMPRGSEVAAVFRY